MNTRMARLALIALLLTLYSLGQDTGQATNQQGQLPTFRKNVNVVNVYFTVKDHHGALIPSLSKDEFEVQENGKPQTIKYFSAETNLPLTLGLLIDSSGSMQRMLPEEKIVAADFLRQVITQKDLAFVISFDISVDLLQDLTSDVHLLRSGLDKARINVGGGSGGIPGLGQGPVPISHPKGTLLYDAVYLASDEVLSKQVGRKAMIVVTDGNDEGSRLKLRDAVEAAQKADAICYVLLLHDPQYGPPGSGEMRQIAEATGGRVIDVSNPKKIGDAFNQISNELRSQYSLGYTPDDDRRDGSFRKIEVKSKNGYKVQARKGYYAPTS
ncbi:MAG TPA: VWA domain-containing protein [Candidatus Angelobacter sp.]